MHIAPSSAASRGRAAIDCERAGQVGGACRRRSRVAQGSDLRRRRHRSRPAVPRPAPDEALRLVQPQRALVPAVDREADVRDADRPQALDAGPDELPPDSATLPVRPDADGPDLAVVGDTAVAPRRVGRAEADQLAGRGLLDEDHVAVVGVGVGEAGRDERRVELERRRVVGERGVEDADPGLDVVRAAERPGDEARRPLRRPDRAIRRQVEVPDRRVVGEPGRLEERRGRPARPARRPWSCSGRPLPRTMPSAKSTSARPIPWRRRSGRTTAILNSGEREPDERVAVEGAAELAGIEREGLQDERPDRVRRREHVAGLDGPGDLGGERGRVVGREQAQHRGHARRAARRVSARAYRPARPARLRRPRSRRRSPRSLPRRRPPASARRRSARPELRVLRRIGRRGRLEHQVGAGLGLREGHDLADVRLVRRAAPPSGRCPSAIPPCGGAPYSNASSIAPNMFCIRSRVWPCSAKLCASRSRPPDPDRAAAQLPAVQRDVVLERPGPPGRVVRRRARAGRPTRSRAAPRPRAATPLNGLWVASQRPFSASHLYIGKRWTQQYARTVRVGQAEPRRRARPGAGRARRRSCRPRRRRSRIRSPGVRAGRLDEPLLDVRRRRGTSRSGPWSAPSGLVDREVDEALRPEPLRALRQLVDLACAWRRPCPGATIALTRPPPASVSSKTRKPDGRSAQSRREVDQLHPEPQVRLVAAEPLHRLVVGEARERHLLDRPLGDRRPRRPR